MKKLMVIGFFLLCANSVHALSVNDKPVYDVTVATTVSVSTSAWTRVPPTWADNTESRLGVEVSNPKTNNATIVGVISISTYVAGVSEATTIRPIELEAGENELFKIGSKLYLYLLSLHTSAENVHIQEYLSK